MPLIRFFVEDISYKLKHKKAIRLWITQSITAEGYKPGNLAFIFCPDDYLLNINRQYLDHDTYTDIITFNNSENEGIISGDIFISVDRVRENALTFNHTETDELHRVIIHGILHLEGYKDKTPVDKKKMTKKEDHYLSKRAFNS